MDNPKDNSLMKIAILSRSPRSYSTKRLKEAAAARGHRVRILDTLKFGIFLEPSSPELTYRTRLFSSFDAVIPRIGSSITFFGSAVVRQFEQMGVYCLNSSNSILSSRDKLRSMQILSSHDVGIADSAFVTDKKDVLPAIKRVGGAPVIIKLLEGTQGVGVILAESDKMAEAIIETLHSTRHNVLIQKFVAESKGKDIRAFVIGDRVVGAMRRKAVGTEFRSNVHRGGTTEQVELTEEYERTAVRAAHILGLRVAGVDMLEGKDGPVIMEVNSSPGLEGIEKCTGIDIAGAIIDHLSEQVHFVDLDIRQRLTMARGYSVVEFTVGADSELGQKPVQESGLRERDIIILRITRGGQHIPLPTGKREILPGDILLCYGDQKALRDYLPHLRLKKKRRKKKKVDDKPTS